MYGVIYYNCIILYKVICCHRWENTNKTKNCKKTLPEVDLTQKCQIFSCLCFDYNPKHTLRLDQFLFETNIFPIRNEGTGLKSYMGVI